MNEDKREKQDDKTYTRDPWPGEGPGTGPQTLPEPDRGNGVKEETRIPEVR